MADINTKSTLRKPDRYVVAVGDKFYNKDVQGHHEGIVEKIAKARLYKTRGSADRLWRKCLSKFPDEHVRVVGVHLMVIKATY